jgi:hypothetical protein
LFLLEGSQKGFADYLQRHLLEGFVAHYNLDLADPGLASCRPIKVCAPAGHILLWDSRVAHCNVPPKREGGLRMCIYVSMQPRVACSEADMKKRQKAFESGRMTGHWCYGDGFCVGAEHPRTYGNDFPKPRGGKKGNGQDPLVRWLVGYRE